MSLNTGQVSPDGLGKLIIFFEIHMFTFQDFKKIQVGLLKYYVSDTSEKHFIFEIIAIVQVLQQILLKFASNAINCSGIA